MMKISLFLCLAILINIGSAQPDTLYLSLDQALSLARQSSPQAKEASIDRHSGILSIAGSIAQILPTPTATASYSKNEITIPGLPADPNFTYSGTVGLNQVLFSPDAFGNVAKGVLYNDYYRLQAQDKSANLVYALKTSYFNLARTYQLLEIADASLARAQDNYALAQEKNRLKQITDFELLRSETYLTQAELDLLTARKNLSLSIEDLKGYLGINDDQIIKPTSTPSLPEEEFDAQILLARINERNPSLQSSKKFKSIAKTSFAQAIANLLPSANLFWSSTYSDTLLPRKLDNWKNNDVISYGVRFAFPVFEIKSYLLNIGSTRNESHRASILLEKARILLRKTATNAVYAYQEAKARYNYALKNLELNRSLLKLAQEQYRLGALSQLDYLNTEVAFTTAQTTYYSALYDAYTSYAQIEYLLGISDAK
jgi:outer membrane protein TolC